jgi:hypothetical protein
MEYKISSNFFLNFVLALAAFFPILPNAGQSIVFGLFLVVSLSYNFFLKKTVKHNFADFLFLTSTIAYYFFALLTFSYSSTISLDFQIIQSNIILFFFPFLLFLNNKDEEKVNLIPIYIFILSSLIFLVILFYSFKLGIDLSYKYYNNQIDFRNYKEVAFYKFLLTNQYEFIESLSEWGYYKKQQLVEINHHHTFLAALFNLCIIFTLYLIEISKKKFLIFALFLLLLFEILLVLYFDSKVNVLFLILAFVVLIIFKFKKKIFNLSFLKVILSILTLTLILNFDLIKEKSQLFIDKDRLILYRNVIPIIKENLIFGIGINNVNKALDSVMVNEKHIYIFNKLVYLKTPHSQYLFYLISGGITNLILFLVMFYVFIHLFVKKDNIYGFLFIILIMLNCLFEDFFNRAWGVYIFTFGTLILFNLRIKKSEIRV